MIPIAWIFWVVRTPTLDHRTADLRCGEPGHTSPDEHGVDTDVLSDEGVGESEKTTKQRQRSAFLEKLFEKMAKMANVEELGEETTRMVERIVVLRVAIKHINLWIRQLEMKRMEIGELAELLGFDSVRKEYEREKTMDRWARR